MLMWLEGIEDSRFVSLSAKIIGMCAEKNDSISS